MVLYLLLINSPALLGCLWDVTDVDLDKFIKIVIEKIFIEKSIFFNFIFFRNLFLIGGCVVCQKFL